MNDILEWLQAYYASCCDGDWEHQLGLSITTLDNPGWEVKIDLKYTSLEGVFFPRHKEEVGEDNWTHCWVDDNIFHGAGGVANLETILQIFRNWHSLNEP